MSRRPRLTPSAMRTAISRRRRSARASSRFATFAQAMSSTIAATPTSHVATLASLPAFGPRSASTGPAKARGLAMANGVRLRMHLELFLVALHRTRCVRSAFAAPSGHARLPARERLRTTSCCRCCTTDLRPPPMPLAAVGADRNERDERIGREAEESLRRDADDRVLGGPMSMAAPNASFRPPNCVCQYAYESTATRVPIGGTSSSRRKEASDHRLDVEHLPQVGAANADVHLSSLRRPSRSRACCV